MTEKDFGFAEWAEYYDEDVGRMDAGDDWIFGGYSRVLDKVIEYCELKPGVRCRVLDIGIGTGNLAARLVALGQEVIGIDPSEEMMSVCRSKHPHIPLMSGDFLSIPLEPRAVDIIVSAYAWHHLTPEEKDRSVTVMKGALRPGGRIVIADLMYRNETEAKRIKRKLIDAGEGEMIEAMEEEYAALYEDALKSFTRHGFTATGEQLTEAIWIIGVFL